MATGFFACPCLKDVMDRFSKSFDLKEKLFTFLRSIEGIEVVVILTELNPKEVRINLRSQNSFDVASLAQQFDGGGHKKAAGCKIYEPLPRPKKQFVRPSIKNYEIPSCCTKFFSRHCAGQ